MGRDGTEVTPNEGAEGMYYISCMHCGKTTFGFSPSYLAASGEVTLYCPSCGRETVVDGKGNISCP